MKQIDTHSEEFQHCMAGYYLREYNRERQFRINFSVGDITLWERRRRGCDVVFDPTKHLAYTDMLKGFWLNPNLMRLA